MFFAVPTCTFKIYTINVATVFRLFFDLSVTHMVHDFDLELNSVNSNDVFTGVVLQIACDESLREEEPTNPENVRSALIDPLL